MTPVPSWANPASPYTPTTWKTTNAPRNKAAPSPPGYAASSNSTLRPTASACQQRFEPPALAVSQVQLRPHLYAHEEPVRREALYRSCRVGPRRLAESEAKPMRADERRRLPEHAARGSMLTCVLGFRLFG